MQAFVFLTLMLNESTRMYLRFLGSRLWCLLCVCHFPIGILGQVWYLIVSIPDLCTLTYFFYITQRLYEAFFMFYSTEDDI